MSMKKDRPDSGMTLVELMVGLNIFFILCEGIYAFNYAFDKMRYEFQTNTKMTDRMKSVTEQIIWGARADSAVERRGVWTANSVTLVSANQISYTDTSGITHQIRQNGQNIEYKRGTAAWIKLYDPNGTLGDDVNQYSTNLTFSATALPTVIRIRLVLGQKIYGRWYYASLSTNAAYRN